MASSRARRRVVHPPGRLAPERIAQLRRIGCSDEEIAEINAVIPEPPPVKRKPGRPRAEAKISPERAIEIMAEFGADDDEIAAQCGMSGETLRKHYSPELARGRAQLRMALRRKQVELALDGNVQLLIWLGKQFLQQRDQISQELSGTNQRPIAIEIYDYASAAVILAPPIAPAPELIDARPDD